MAVYVEHFVLHLYDGSMNSTVHQNCIRHHIKNILWCTHQQ